MTISRENAFPLSCSLYDDGRARGLKIRGGDLQFNGISAYREGPRRAFANEVPNVLPALISRRCIRGYEAAVARYNPPSLKQQAKLAKYRQTSLLT